MFFRNSYIQLHFTCFSYVVNIRFTCGLHMKQFHILQFYMWNLMCGSFARFFTLSLEHLNRNHNEKNHSNNYGQLPLGRPKQFDTTLGLIARCFSVCESRSCWGNLKPTRQNRYWVQTTRFAVTFKWNIRRSLLHFSLLLILVNVQIRITSKKMMTLGSSSLRCRK